MASQALVHVFYAFELPEWSPDGKSIMVKLRPRSGGEAPVESVASREARDTLPAVIVLSSRGDSASSAKSQRPGELIAQRYRSDLAAIDVGTGAVRRLTHRLLVLRYWLSPDGEHLAFTTLHGTRSLASERTLYDLHVVSLRTGRSRIAAGRIPQVFGSGVSWSPDGSLLAFTADPLSSESSQADTAGGCFVVAPDTGAPRRITDEVPRRVASAFQPPLWDSTGRYLYLVANDTLFRLSADGRDVRAFPTPPGVRIEFILSSSKSRAYWSPDGADSLYLALLDTTTLSAALARVDLRTGAVDVRPFGDQLAPLGVWQQDGVGNALAYVGESASSPADIWMRNAETNTTRRMTRLDPALDRVRYGGVKLVSWRSSDGVPLRGALLLPPSYRPGTRVPLVVYVYGGSRLSSRISSFGGGLSGGDNLQILATRGFAVLLPDAPLRVGTPMADLAKTVLPGVDRLIDLGIADPDRVGIMGASYGGYSVLALLTQTTRFRAAVSIAGLSDLIAAYGQLTPDGSADYISFAESGQGRMGGSLWAYRDRYIENSPLFHLDRVDTPVLLIHGTDDMAVPVVLANETYAALTRLGKDVVYVRYRGEGHTIRSFANARDYARRVVNWFDTYLRPGASTGAVGSQ